MPLNSGDNVYSCGNIVLFFLVQPSVSHIFVKTRDRGIVSRLLGEIYSLGHARIYRCPFLLSCIQVKVMKAEMNVYAAIIDEKVAMKIGPGYYEPQTGPQKWSLATEGKDYKVGEAA